MYFYNFVSVIKNKDDEKEIYLILLLPLLT